MDQPARAHVHPEGTADAVADQHGQLTHAVQPEHDQRRTEDPDERDGRQLALDGGQRRLVTPC